MNTSATANVARAAFVMLTTLLGISIALGQGPNHGWIGALAGLIFGLLILVIDLGLRNFSIKGFSAGTFGLLIGLLCAWLVTRVGFFESGLAQQYEIARNIFELCAYLGLGFIGMMVALRSKRDEFSLVIPYVRFRQDSVQDSPLLIDSTVIIDGRISRLCATGFMNGPLIVPRFVLDEVQAMADSGDSIRRDRGNRGLESLSQLRKASSKVEVVIHEDSPANETTADGKLTELARVLGAHLLTSDASLSKVARLRNVTVLNLNELNQAMRPTVAPGDEIELTLVKEGKDEHQGVGYLPDGTMIVVNHAVDKIGTSQQVVVAGSVQTSAGRLIFAELNDTVQAPD